MGLKRIATSCFVTACLLLTAACDGTGVGQDECVISGETRMASGELLSCITSYVPRGSMSCEDAEQMPVQGNLDGIAPGYTQERVDGCSQENLVGFCEVDQAEALRRLTTADTDIPNDLGHYVQYHYDYDGVQSCETLESSCAVAGGVWTCSR